MSNLLKTFASTVDVKDGPKVELFPEPIIPENSSIMENYNVYEVMCDESWALQINLTNGTAIDFTGLTAKMNASIWDEGTVSTVELAASIDISSDLPNGKVVLICPKDTLPTSFANDFDRTPNGSVEIDIELILGTDKLWIFDRINVIDNLFGGTGDVAPNSKNYLQTADVKPQVPIAAGYIAPTAASDITQKQYVDDADTVISGNLTTHENDTANPHTVTAAQVGNATAQWNCDKIQGKTVDDTDIGTDKFLKYDGVNIVYVDNPGLPSAVQGDILYHNGTDFTRLPSGSNGTVLKSNGLLSDPSWEVVAGTGDFVGPASSIADNLVAFDGATGKLGKDSAIALADVTVQGGTVQTGTDAVQMIFKAHSSQTVDILQVQNSAGTAIAGFNKDGLMTDPKTTNASKSTISALEVDWAVSNRFSKSISSNETFTFANVTDEQVIVLDITSSVGALLTLPVAVTALNGGTFTADARNIITLYSFNGGTEVFATFGTV